MRELPTGTVTLLFSDIEGSTRLLQHVGERYPEVLDACRHLLRTAFHQYQGHEVDTQGDSFFVAFARASDAVAAAVAAQRALASHAWPQGVKVHARMGLHTGEPQRTTEGYVGLDVHLAARIMSAGHGGQVLLSQSTRHLVEHSLPEGVSLQDLGEHRLKDLQHPSHLFQLVMEGFPAEFPALKTLDTPPHNLPIQPTPFIGREREVATVEQLLEREDVRLLTLTGPGGSGKTRLALQVAAELSDCFADGVFFVNLAPLSEPDLVVPTIAQTLGVKESATRSMQKQLQAFLQEKDLLLLLDNFEQVIAAAPKLSDLLSACPHLTLLITSRQVLRLAAEHQFAVPPLAVPDPTHLPDLVTLSQFEAVALFIARAQAAKPAFQVTNVTAPAVAEICARLEGLPLAIELAAARVTLLPPQALLARLGQPLALLTGGVRDAPARQQTLGHTIDWSYQLLAAQEQQLFRRLSVFVGGCTLEAIEAVSRACGSGVLSVMEGVASLLDKSLLRQSEPEGEEPRFVLLEMIREYGLEVLSTNGEEESTRQAHAAYYLGLAEVAEPELSGPQQSEWFERLEQEHDNLRAALRWLLARAEDRERIEQAVRLAGALFWFWLGRFYIREGRTFLEQALAGSQGVAVSVRAKALWAAGGLACQMGDFDRAEALSQESLALSRTIGDTAGMAHASFHLGIVAWYMGELVGARSRFEESLGLAKQAGDNWGTAWSLCFLAQAYIWQGEHTQGRSLAEAALALFKELGNKLGIFWALYYLGDESLYFQGDVAQAAVLYQEDLAVAREIGYGVGEALGALGAVCLYRGELVRARSLLEESVELLQSQEGNANKVWSLSNLAKLAALEGDDTTARALYEECLAIARGEWPFINVPDYLEGLAVVLARQGELSWAARLWGAAESLRTNQGTPLPPVARADYERSVAAARAQLGEPAFVAAWAEGHGMTLDQVLVAREAVAMPLSPPTPHLTAPPAEKSPRTSPAGLTAREVEVLRLLAQGLTNEQIAEQLVISPRAVNTRLNSIYGKIQVSSRSAATRYVIEHHLV